MLQKVSCKLIWKIAHLQNILHNFCSLVLVDLNKNYKPQMQLFVGSNWPLSNGDVEQATSSKQHALECNSNHCLCGGDDGEFAQQLGPRAPRRARHTCVCIGRPRSREECAYTPEVLCAAVSAQSRLFHFDGSRVRTRLLAGQVASRIVFAFTRSRCRKSKLLLSLPTRGTDQTACMPRRHKKLPSHACTRAATQQQLGLQAGAIEAPLRNRAARA